MTTENVWMLVMAGMFGLFLRGLQVEARRSLQAIARDNDDITWRAEMEVVMAQRNARQRLLAMRQEQEQREAARLARAEREAFRAAQLRRTRWEYDAPRHTDEVDLSGEAFGDHGFARIAEIIDEDELYVPVRSFNERVGRLAEPSRDEHHTDESLEFEAEFSRGNARRSQLVCETVA